MIDSKKIQEFIDLKGKIDKKLVSDSRDGVSDYLKALSDLAEAIEIRFSDDAEDAAAVWGYISDSYFSTGAIEPAIQASDRQLDALIYGYRICNDDKKESLLDRISDALYNIIEYRNRIKYRRDYESGEKFSDDPCQEYMDKVNGILQDAPNVYIHATNRAKNAFKAG